MLHFLLFFFNLLLLTSKGCILPVLYELWGKKFRPFNRQQFVPISRETIMMVKLQYCFLGTFGYWSSLFTLRAQRFLEQGLIQSYLSISFSSINSQTSTYAGNAEHHAQQEGDCISSFHCVNHGEHWKQWNEDYEPLCGNWGHDELWSCLSSYSWELMLSEKWCTGNSWVKLPSSFSLEYWN